MDPILVLAISMAIFSCHFLCILAYRYFHQECTCKEKHATFIQDLSESTALLKSSTLLSRARPNQRLVRAFSISNAFTTTDPIFYKAFLDTAKSLLRSTDASFSTLTHQALILAREASSSIPANETTPLTPLIQVLCFRFVVFKFFPSIQLSTSSTSSILRITKLINSLWISSKCSCSLNHSQFSMQQSLHRELGSIFSISTNDRNGNPLNILLPAYETLWRIVLRCFLEVSFRHPSDVTAGWRVLFEEFLANPTLKQFSERNGECSVQDIVSESLRLYPPTRSIYRQEHENGEILAVDVEYVQRIEEVWGIYREKFSPNRWSILESKGDPAYKKTWIPFGKGTFKCPAYKVAPIMIGILVGSLVNKFDGSSWVLEGGGESVLEDRPLENGREALEEFLLRKIKTNKENRNEDEMRDTSFGWNDFDEIPRAVKK